MKTLVSVVSLLACTVAAAEQSAVAVRTVEGATVQVAATEVRRAFAALSPSGIVHEGMTVNSDGSVTITQPRFVYNGAPIPMRGNITGMCRLAGYEVGVTAEPFGGLCSCAVVDAYGGLASIESYEWASGVRLLTCR